MGRYQYVGIPSLFVLRMILMLSMYSGWEEGSFFVKNLTLNKNELKTFI